MITQTQRNADPQTADDKLRGAREFIKNDYTQPVKQCQKCSHVQVQSSIDHGGGELLVPERKNCPGDDLREAEYADTYTICDECGAHDSFEEI